MKRDLLFNLFIYAGIILTGLVIEAVYIINNLSSLIE